MSHMVIFRTADGQPGYHQAEELTDAVQFVERLRNTEGVEHTRIFRMEEVEFDFKPYYKVEVPTGGEAAAPPAPAYEPPAYEAPSFDPGSFEPAPAGEVPAGEVPAAEPMPVPGDLPSPSETSWGEPAPAAPPGDLAPPPPPPVSVPEPLPDSGLGLSDPPPPPPAPVGAPAGEGTTSEDAASSGNGIGARRGLFGR